MIQNKPKPQRKEINLIPLVNVIFLLLTFFIIAGSIERVDPLTVRLPLTMQKENGKPANANIVYINKNGEIAVNNDLVTRKDFHTIINTLLIENKGTEIIIKSDAEVKSTDLIWVMKEIEAVGGIDVSIVTKVMPHEAS